MNKRQKIMSWIGTTLCLVGAFLVANTIFLIGYIFFAIGAIIWIYISRIQKNDALLFQEICFLMANINGLITYWSY